MAEAMKWYLAKGDRAVGPFDLARLRQMATAGAVGRNDLVCAEGHEDWVAAATVPGLFPSPPPRPGGDRTAALCGKCGTKLPVGEQSCPRCRQPPTVQTHPAAAEADPVLDKRGFSGKLVAQTVGVWFAVGLFSGACVEASCLGINMVLGAIAAGFGAGCVGLLSLTSVEDKWYLLRWVNHVLERVAAGAFFGGLVAVLLLVVFGGMPVSGSVDNRTDQAKVLQSLILRSFVLFGLLAGLVVCLVRTWGRVRHADLPTALREF